MTILLPGGEVKHVFVYGSLLAEEVLRVLIGRIPDGAAAYVADYHRFSIKGRSYPAAAPKQGGRLEGKVYYNLTEHEQAVFDEFESDDYEKCLVDAILMDDLADGDANGSSIRTVKSQEYAPTSVKAYVYSWADPRDPNLYGSWDYEKFRRESMPTFLRMCTVFKTELSRQWGPPPLPVE